MNNIHLHIIGSKSFPALLNELDLNYIITSDINLKYNHKDLLIRIVFVEKLKLIEIKKYFNENVPTIFLLNNRDFLLKNKLRLLEFQVSLFIPIEILSFREILNILITKYNFFKGARGRFVAQLARRGRGGGPCGQRLRGRRGLDDQQRI